VAFDTPPDDGGEPLQHDAEALDAYSRAVVAVAEAVLPSVASLVITTRRGQGAGSASVITRDGFLLTSAHVVVGAESAEAAFADGTRMRADVVGRDTLSDLAVLHARGDVPAPVPLGDAARLRVGQLVVALGNPLGLAGTVTTVAAVEIGLATYDRDRIHHFVLTHDAAEDVFRTLATESRADRIHNPGLEEARADVIVGGCCVLVAIFRRLGFDEMLVSESDILDGLALSLLPVP
jgi:hypothetical protein